MRKEILGSAKRLEESSRMRFDTFHVLVKTKCSDCWEEERATCIVTSSIASKRTISLRAGVWKTGADVIISSLSSSHRPVTFMKAITSETTNEHDGEVRISIFVSVNPPSLCSVSCARNVWERVDLTGPVLDFSNTRSSSKRFRSSSRYCGKYFGKFLTH